LFGDTSTLARTDPELIGFFDNWAFDEVLRDAAELDGTLDLRTRLLVQLAATAAAGGSAESRVRAAAALANGGVTPFGDVVARHGLDLQTREQLIVALLAGLGGADAQLRGHVSGNLNVGNTRARLLAVLTVIAPFIGYPRTLNALAAINDIAVH
jgi:alkylhydroperoxidase/carboxymuconolactone decarboxylase family protein YurZ